jgi:excinuclease ABC subunit B
MGRAARNVDGRVVLYADETTGAMESAIEETRRRREIQQQFNADHGHEPKTIEKEVGETNLPGSKTDTGGVSGVEADSADEAEELIERLEGRMQEAADNLEFELAADIRDRIRELRETFEELDDPDEGVPTPDDEF